MKKTLLTLAVMLAGTLGIHAQTLTLSDNYDQVAKINEKAEQGGTWTIRFSSSRAINQDNWNVLVLPFDVPNLRMLSKAFGYAAVDVLNVNNDVPNTMHFVQATSVAIPAGTPFVFKPTSDEGAPKDFKNVIGFTNVEVKKVEAQMVQTDKNGNRFIGVFSPTTFYGKGLMIIIDEPDGTTTVIDPATFNKGEFKSNGTQDDGWYSVTGMRLTQEPTAKGVYIHNARKVVIK